MTYKETIQFLFNSLPMYQRIGDVAIKKDLINIEKLSSMLDHPHKAFPSIHIAGTNGKGSTSHMLASIFQAAGNKTGLYTSPHYVDFRERIKINGKMIGEAEVIKFVKKYKDKWKTFEPSFFEITVAMAFDHFRNENVDMAIIETGLGGRLDSTNIIQPMISVITNIGYDHMQMLGHTLPEIAFEKAGIIKKNTPVVIGEWQAETNKVFIDKAEQQQAPVHFASRHLVIGKEKSNPKELKFNIKTRTADWLGSVKTDLTGPYQLKNIRTVLETCWVWNKYYSHEVLKPDAIRKGLKNVKQSTNMIGRWMILNEKPLVITDAAHNIDGIKNIMPDIKKIKAEKKHFVLGFVNDKDVRKILSLFPRNADYYWCSPDIPRGKPATESRETGDKIGLKGDSHQSVIKAYKAALANAGKKDFIFIGGSSYVVGDLIKKVGQLPYL